MVRRSTAARCTAFLFCFLFVVSFQFTSNAMAAGTEAGTYGASFLRIPVGSQLIASTEIVAGMRPDASIVFSNPAAIAGIPRGQMSITTANWLDDMQMSAASVVFPISQSSLRLGFSTRLLYSGGLKGYDDALRVVSEQNYYDLGLSTALGYRFDSIGLSLGVGMTYIREHLYPEDGNGYAFSFGASYQRAKNSVHFFARDIGGEVSFDGYRYPIDGRYVLGYGRTLNLRQGNLNVGAQVTFTRGDTKQLQFGSEYEFNRYLVVRTAFNQYLDSPETSQFPLSGGLGFRFWNMAIDYAFTPHSYFPATHMFSFSYTFGRLNAPSEPDFIEAPTTAPVFPSSPAAQGKPVNDRLPVADEAEPAGARPAADRPEKTIQDILPQKSPGEEKKKPSYTLMVGVHGRKESAIAEVRALTLLGIPAYMENLGSRYRVAVGRYTSRKAARSAAKSFEGRGYRFEIIQID